MKTPVSQYFDSIADDYDHRYDASARPYHSYLHQQRLRNAAGGITEISLPHATFDLIFMLGVSTYLSPEVWQAVLARVTTLLAPDGRFIVSFTNPRSLDWHVRSMIRRVWRGTGVLGQPFETFAYLPDVATHPLRLHHAERYNASLTPINTLLPRLSFWVLRWADQHLPQGLRSLCCADIVAVYRK